PFEVDGGDGAGKVRVALARLPQRLQAVGQRGKGVGDQGRTEGADPVAATGGNDVADRVEGQALRGEAVAVAAVDLRVEQGRGDPAGLHVGGAGGGDAQGLDAAVLANNLHGSPGAVVTGMNTHGEVTAPSSVV